jgi:esterase
MNLHHTTLGAGAPLIVLHGLLGSHQNLLPACRSLATQFQVFALDQRNHGHSPHHDEMHYDIMADDIARFMDRHQLETAHILGHSMGGKTAMQFALNHPGRVRRLVVVDMSPRAYAPRFAGLLEALRNLQPGRFKTRIEADQALALTVPEAALRQFVLKNLMPDERGGHCWRNNIEAIAAGYERLREAVRAPAPFDRESLFVLGGKSDYVGDQDREEIHRLFPRAQFQTIANAGHWVHAEKPSEFAAAVLQFLTASQG